MKVTREIKAAVLVIASVLLFIWGYSFLKGRDLFSDYKVFYAYFDNVEGLNPSAPVTINGLIVGKVNKIELEQSGKLKIEIQVKGNFPISKSSKINIYEPGLIGGKQIQIVPDFSSKTLAESGDVLQSGIVPGLTDLVAEKLTPLQERVEKMVVSADAVLQNINDVLDAKTKDNLKQSIANLTVTLGEFKEISGNVNTMLSDNKTKIDQSLTNIQKASGNFSKLSDSIAAANIGKTIKTVETSIAKLDGILSGVEKGKGSLGKIVQDPSLYENLNKTSKELELLLEDLRLNPTRYINVSIFGKKNKPYKSNKKDTIAKP